MKKIGILSDTHGILRPEVLDSLAGCDAVLHGGDFGNRKILERLEEIAPVHAVRGNNDKEWAEFLPDVLKISLFGLRVCMAHKKKDLPKSPDESDLMICGHTHRYEDREEKGVRLINPGSCGPVRLRSEITMAMLEINETDGSFGIRRIDIRPGKQENMTADGVRKQDIERVIREIRRGRSVRQTAEATGLSEALAEQICRLYLTHPGVDAEGIMKKMGL